MNHEWMMGRGEKAVPACALRSFPSSPSRASRLSSARGVVRGRRGPGVPVTPLGRLSFEQTTYNFQVAKTPWQYLGRKSHCWKAHFFKICFFVEYFRQRLLSLVNMGLHAAIIRLSPLIHEGEQRWVASLTPLWKILATPLRQLE